MVLRPRLIAALNEGLAANRQVTLVSAPAGFGKTSCISDWVGSLAGWQAAWLSLDALDDDPARFFTYFIAALQRMRPDLGREIQGVIGAGQLPPCEVISTTLINELLTCNGRFLLVLDDFHVIQDAFILRALEYLIEHIPGRFHLALVTREDPPLPLARLRAHGNLTEIRARDLRFSGEETGRFLREVMGLPLSQVDVAALEDKTEGWIAGLQLAAIALHHHGEQPFPRPAPLQEGNIPSDFVAGLGGSHRYILGYLTEQVLNRQSEDVRRFLLETAVLDRFTGDLCDAVCGRSGSDALLEELFSANLFLIPLDDERRWYRYHYLFAELLRDLHHTLHKERIVELHRRASRWFVQMGMVDEAIRHALAAGDYPAVVDLLENHSMGLIMRGYAKSVNAWVQALPEAWRFRSPRTSLAFAWALMLRGAYAEAPVQLERLQALLAAPSAKEETPAVYAEWLVMRAFVLYMQNKMMECLEKAVEALAYTGEGDGRVRSLAYYIQGSALRLQGNDPEAAKAFQQSIRESRAADIPVPEMMSTASLAGMAFEHGQLRLAFDVAAPVVDRMERASVLHPISAMIYAVLGEVHFQWGQFEAARRDFQQALRLSILGGANTITLMCRVLLSRLCLAQGDVEAADREIQAADDLIPSDAPAYVRQEVVSQRVRVWLANDRFVAAEAALRGLGVSFDDLPALFAALDPANAGAHIQGDASSGGLLANSVLRLFLRRAQAENAMHSIRPALELANRLVVGALESQQAVVLLETLLLRAQLHEAAGAHAASAADYREALERAEAEGFVGVFVEGGQRVAENLAGLVRSKQVGDVQPGFVERVMAACSKSGGLPADSPAVKAADAMIEALTERESQVLRLMDEGLKYREIAARLYISQNTVRYHVKSIFGKLQVDTRTRAVAKARLFHLL